MFRLIASALIALVAISSSLAHAQGGPGFAGDETSEHIVHHSHSETPTVADHDDEAPASHEDHGGACVFGHCATACGVILPSFSAPVSFAFAKTGQETAEKVLVGLNASSDPPPPKA